MVDEREDVEGGRDTAGGRQGNGQGKAAAYGVGLAAPAAGGGAAGAKIWAAL